MEEILNYLQMKNKFYEKYYKISQRLMDALLFLKLDNLEYFTDSRDRIISILSHFDRKIAYIFEKLKLEPWQMEPYKEPLKACFERKEELSKKIVELDLELIAKMDELKSETIRELKKTVESTRQISAFQSSALKREV